MKKRHLPERWTEYIPCGRRIPGTRFIAFKVPLKTMYDSKLAPRQRFSIDDLINEVDRQNEELGLIVDLTCTKRYYFPEELPHTIKYVKIFTAGHRVPSDEVIHQFKSIVKQYLSENSENDKLIGVHCTHGLNRTGYLVCRYMIDVFGIQPAESIDKFNVSRGHCIERKNYIDDLLRGKTRNNAGLDRPLLPRGRNPQHVPGSRPPPCQGEQPWLHGSGPRLPAPAFFQPPVHHMPVPRHSFSQAGNRHPSHFVNPGPGPTIPAPSFPHMPGSRHSFPEMESNPAQQSGGGHSRRRHHQYRHFSPPEDGNSVNGTPAQDSAGGFPQQRGSSSGNGAPPQGSGPQQHRQNGPYQRHRGPGRRGKPQQQWQ